MQRGVAAVRKDSLGDIGSLFLDSEVMGDGPANGRISCATGRMVVP